MTARYFVYYSDQPDTIVNYTSTLTASWMFVPGTFEDSHEVKHERIKRLSWSERRIRYIDEHTGRNL